MTQRIPCPNCSHLDSIGCSYCERTGLATLESALRWEHWLNALAAVPYHFAHVIAWRAHLLKTEHHAKVMRARIMPDSVAARPLPAA